MRPLPVVAAVAVAIAAAGVATAPAAAPRPSVELSAPRVNSDASRSRTAQLSWSGRGAPGLRFRIEYRRNTAIGARWRALGPETTNLGARFRGRPGITYQFRLRARDGSGRVSRYAYGRTVFPFDERGPRLRFSPEWKRVRRPGAYGRTLTITNRPGATATVNLEGSRVLVIARKVRTGGRMLATLDGQSAEVSLRGPSHHRLAIFRSRVLEPGEHRLRLRSLGGGRVNVDAVATVQGAGARRR